MSHNVIIYVAVKHTRKAKITQSQQADCLYGQTCNNEMAYKSGSKDKEANIQYLGHDGHKWAFHKAWQKAHHSGGKKTRERSGCVGNVRVPVHSAQEEDIWLAFYLKTCLSFDSSHMVSKFSIHRDKTPDESSAVSQEF